MRWLSIVSILIASCAGSSSFGDDDVARTSREQRCTELQEHVLDLRLSGIDAGETPEHAAVDVEAHRRNLRDAMGGSFVSSCIASLSDDQLRCALDAADSVAAARCAGGTP